MTQHLEKMKREKADLEGKIKKAVKAVEQPPYGMGKNQIMLLAEQIKYMQGYLECLNARIELGEKDYE